MGARSSIPPHPMRIRVIGSGPVGYAFALFASRQGIPAQGIELERAGIAPPAALANRPLALSLGTWQLLSRIARLPASAPISTVDVSIAGHPGSVRIGADESGVPALGHVVRYATLLGSLDEALARAGWDRPDARDARPVATSDRPAAAVPEPDLIVHAEGDAGSDASRRTFGQTALLAEVRIGAGAARGRAGTAFECFTADGPLALLPLPEARRYALVWCAAPADATRRAALPSEEFDAELRAAFGWSLGELSLESTPVVVPLARRARRELVAGRHAWIGNAAQSLHPVAGQGLNLGIRDAFELARCLGDASAAGLGADEALRRYRRSRRVDRSATIAITDTLASVFALSPLRPLQSVALVALDAIPAARALLARQFMFGTR